jgi:hypothetical protein
MLDPMPPEDVSHRQIWVQLTELAGKIDGIHALLTERQESHMRIRRDVDGVVATVNRMNQSRPPGNQITPQQFLQGEMDNLAAVLADYEKIAVVTSLGFVQRFTPQEYAAIRAAADQSEKLGAIVEKLIQAPTIVLTDPRIAPALALLTSAGLLAPGRAEEIVTWERPEFVETPKLPNPEPVQNVNTTP